MSACLSTRSTRRDSFSRRGIGPCTALALEFLYRRPDFALSCELIWKILPIWDGLQVCDFLP
jgi:hypothetical protein